MDKNLTFNFIVDKQNKSITVVSEFDAPLAMVWDAYTKSELLDQWWAPKPWKAKTKKMDFTVGGQWLYAMVGPEDEKHWSVEKYTLIEPQKKIVLNDAFTDEDGNINEAMPQSTRQVTFTDKSPHTVVEFKMSFSDVAQLDAILEMGFKDGISMTTENLDALLTMMKK